MYRQATVIELLRRARDLIDEEHCLDIVEAIRAMKSEVSGPRRDVAYYAILETASERMGQADMTALSSGSKEKMLALIDATIKRITSKLH